MSKTTKRKIGNGLFAMAIGLLAFLAALPAFAQEQGAVDVGALPVPALLGLCAFGVAAVVRVLREVVPAVAESKRLTALAAALAGVLAGAFGLAGGIGDGLAGRLFAGLVAGALAFWSAGTVGPKARFEG